MIPKPRGLDLYCGQGGVTKGYQRAGFYMVGVDILTQPRYCGDEFVQADALEYVAAHGHEFDFIHGSPPCLKYQKLNTRKQAEHPDLIGPTRLALRATGKPYVIENVPAARRLLIDPILLCGSMFGLNVRRHRYFEMWPDNKIPTLACRHVGHPILLSGVSRIKGQPRIENTADECRAAAGLEWMTRVGIDQAIPPAFTEYIGRYLMSRLAAPAWPWEVLEMEALCV